MKERCGARHKFSLDTVEYHYIAILRKVNNFAMRYFDLNAGKNTSVKYSRVCANATNSLICFITLISVQLQCIQCKTNIYFVKPLHNFNARKTFLKKRYRIYSIKRRGRTFKTAS